MENFRKTISHPLSIKIQKILIFLCAIILGCGICFGSVSFAVTNDEDPTITPPSVGYTIVVDPGHGGIDPGSIGYKTKVKESDLNLKLSLMLADKLRAVGIRVIMTRTDENSLADGLTGKSFKKEDMRLRKEMISKIRPNMVVSVHMNSFTNHVLRGAKMFYDKTSEISRKIAESIQKQFAENLEASNDVASVGDYYMLKCTESPSVIAECGFLSNARDEQLLLDQSYQEKIVNCIFVGIIDFLNLK
ncbi:MAG: N-acetylmuramoyl-L-alanine amidase [Clostridia bacterium]|nr:N-acetylmuramoyl-L-alanine amidase [Clostridia bacterium]